METIITNIEKLLPRKEDKITIGILPISPIEAMHLMQLFFINNDSKFERMYKSKASEKKVSDILVKYRSGMWNSTIQENITTGSIMLFFRDDNYQSFYEGKHRMIALSKMKGEIESLNFICAVGWPGSLNTFRDSKGHGNNYREVLASAISNGKRNIIEDCFEIDKDTVSYNYGK